MAEVDPTERLRRGERVVACARSWVGTPYRHQSSCKGAGTDCLGLLRGIWRELLGAEPETVPPYTADWSEAGEGEDLLGAAGRNLRAIARDNAVPGDVLILRMADRGAAKHVGILARAREGRETLIHAYSGHGVVESPLTPAWSRRVAGTFRLPCGGI
jgi:NlpC/P60 family putative phage cell wall peptidase